MLLQGDYYLVFDITRMNDVQYSKFLKMVRYFRGHSHISSSWSQEWQGRELAET